MSARYSGLISARANQKPCDTKLIIFVIGGLSHQEVVSIQKFERNQILHGKWSKERIISGSTHQDILTGYDLIEMLEQLNLDLDKPKGFR
jgi:hypothetical protein